VCVRARGREELSILGNGLFNWQSVSLHMDLFRTGDEESRKLTDICLHSKLTLV